MSRAASYRQILRASSISGGASIVSIALGMVRMKVAAVMLGPAGVGLVGVYANLMDSATTLAGLGMGMAATREVASAAAREDAAEVHAWRRSALLATLGLGIAAGLAVWMLRRPLSQWLLQDGGRSGDIGWLAFGVAFGVVATSQTALLNGLRRIGDLARVNVIAALVATLAGSAILGAMGIEGLAFFVILGPLAILCMASWFAARAGIAAAAPSPLRWLERCEGLLRIGAPLMLAALVGTLAQLGVRTLVQRQLGDDGLGHFQAAWTISMTGVGLVLQAMGTDYYPRLTAVVHDAPAANRLINEQTHVALLLASPVCLGMLALAPWVIELLYSDRFLASAELLRWQVLADVLKVASWPLGYLLLAAGRSRTYFLTELAGLAVFVATTAVLLPRLGLAASGVGFILMYLVYLPMVFALARARNGFGWEAGVRRQLVLTVVCAVLVFAVGAWWPAGAAILGVPAALAFLARAGFVLARTARPTDGAGS